MNKLLVSLVTVAALGGALALPVAADASPPSDGSGYVVVTQGGQTTHRVCENVDLVAHAEGFPSNQTFVAVNLVQPGYGPSGSNPLKIPLTNGRGDLDLGYPSLMDVPYLRLRYGTGAGKGSWSYTVIACSTAP